MEESLLNLINDKHLTDSETDTSGLFILDCDPPSQRSVFNDPDLLEGRMTKTMTVVLLIIAIITICINMGVIIRIYKLIKKGGDLRPAFFFIGNLAASDFLVGFYIVSVFCIDLSQFSSNWRNKCCGLLIAISVTACQETICTIMLIAIDKYIFICHGLSYRRIVTRKRVWIAIFVTWLGSLLIGFLPWFGLHEDNWCACSFLLYINKDFAVILFITAVVLPVIIITSMYSIILSLAIKVTRRKIEAISSKSSNGVSSVLRPFSQFKSSKFSNSTSSSKLSNTDSSTSVKKPLTSETKRNENSRKEFSRKKSKDPKTDIDAQPSETTPLNCSLSTNVPGCKISNLPTVVELRETDLTVSYETDSREGSDSEVSVDDTTSFHISIPTRDIELRTSRDGSYDLVNFQRNTSITSDFQVINNESPTNTVYLKSYKQYSENETGSNHNSRELTRKDSKVKQERNEELKNEGELSSDTEEEPANYENYENARKLTRTWRHKSYYKKLAAETKDKVQFLQKCRAIKPIFLIMFCFIVTYVPFVTGTFAFKVQKEKNEHLFKALNNLLYFAVVLNSLMNPFVYAYGYKEFRLKTKKFKGILAKERKDKRRL